MKTRTRANTTDKAVKQLRAYARYIYEHAEAIIGDIDAPMLVIDDGIRLSFTLFEYESVPILEVSKQLIVLDALDGGRS